MIALFREVRLVKRIKSGMLKQASELHMGFKKMIMRQTLLLLSAGS